MVKESTPSAQGMSMNGLADLFALLRTIIPPLTGGHRPVRIIVVLDDGEQVRLPVPALVSPSATPNVAPPFIPNDLQAAILEALEGKALRADDLAAAAGYDRRQLYRKPGGLEELTAQGLVAKHARLGYYSTSSPPPDLDNE